MDFAGSVRICKASSARAQPLQSPHLRRLSLSWFAIVHGLVAQQLVKD
jgi:hypothetical protein